jgi:NAD(P)-dependent dehydrogenase (short-subunit alcohol dehydrogenase family)
MEGKGGLVTGAAGGIGRATALALAREGASVLVNDLESRRADGEETVRQIEELGGTAFFSAADVSSAADNARLVEEAVGTFGALDYAHNNAGVELHASISETTAADFDHIINVNLKAVVWLLSDRASFVTGAPMPVDAGSTAF